MDNKVIAKVGEREITIGDVKIAKTQIPKEHQNMIGNKELLNQMVIQEMIYLNALEEKLDTQEDFLKEMETVKANKLKEYAINKILSNVEVKEEDVKAFYENNKENFKTEETVRASHILVDDKDKAEEILNEVKNGKDFAEAAQEYSKCPSKDNGGDLGFFGRGRMVPEFEKAALDLEIGEIGDVAETQFGYHIVKLEERKKSESLSFEQVKNKIKDYLLGQERSEAFAKVTEGLRSKYTIDINEALLNEI